MHRDDWIVVRHLGPSLTIFAVYGVLVLVRAGVVLGIFRTHLDVNRAALRAHSEEVDRANRTALY